MTLSPDNKSERAHWVLVTTIGRHGNGEDWGYRDIWSVHTWRNYASGDEVQVAWNVVAESESIAELEALGNLLEGSWVGSRRNLRTRGDY